MEYGSRIKCGMTIMLALLSILRQFLYLWYPDEVLSQGLTQCFVTSSCSASSPPHEALRQRVMQCFVRKTRQRSRQPGPYFQILRGF